MPLFAFTRGLLYRCRMIFTDSDKTQFWIAQIFMIISTVLGVYLASHTGFEKAMEFDHVKTKRTVYYMMTALENELSDNVLLMEQVVNNTRGVIDYSRKRALPERMALDKYVWETMQESTETFHIPADIITGIRRYYRNVNTLVARYGASEIGHKYLEQQIEKENKKVQKFVIARLREERELLYQELIKEDIIFMKTTTSDSPDNNELAADGQAIAGEDAGDSSESKKE